MSETNPMLQLSPAPAAPVPESPAAPVESIQQTAAPAPEAAPKLDDSQLTEAEKKAYILAVNRSALDRRFLPDRAGCGQDAGYR